MDINVTNIYINEKKGNLRVAQFGDLHLGAKISDFNKINSLTGNNCQWDDQIAALRKATELVVESDPAVAIYPGDIYDRPSNISEKLQAAFQESILTLIQNKIAVVLFTGNHDFPKSREYKALISRYDGIGEYLNVATVYKAQYEQININDEVLIHCIPQCFSKEQFKDELELVKRDDNFPVNILTTHIGIQGAGIDEYEHAEAWLNKMELEFDIDYIALGDYHRPVKVSDKCAYAGVLCKGNFSDRDSKHGILVYHGDTSDLEFKEYSVRGMQQFSIDCKTLDVCDIDAQLEEIYSTLDTEIYIKIELLNISKLKQRQLDFKNIHNIKKESYYCKISYVYLKEEVVSDKVLSGEEETDSSLKSIPDEVKQNLQTISTDETEAVRLFNIYNNKIRKDS